MCFLWTLNIFFWISIVHVTNGNTEIEGSTHLFFCFSANKPLISIYGDVSDILNQQNGTQWNILMPKSVIVIFVCYLISSLKDKFTQQ